MRRALLAVIAATMLSGCASVLESAYDEQARDECDRSARAGERGECYDRVDQNRRDHK